MTRPHVVVIGAGFGGIRVVRGLRRAPVRLTVIDPNNFHTFQPLLYQVATSGLDGGDISFPVRGLLRRNREARFVMGAVTAIDLDGRTVTLDDGRAVAFDYLVIAAGAVSTSFGIAGVDEFAFPLKTLADALSLRTHLLRRFEAASRGAEPHPPLGIVVVGGGPTGVETAGGLRELIDRVLSKDYPELDTTTATTTLVEAAPRLLGMFHESLSAKAADALRDRGVEVITGVGVHHIEADTVVLADGRRLPAGTVVWAAGVTAHPLAAALGIELARGGRVPVEPNLSIAGHPNVFAIGDIAAVRTGDDGGVLPQVAQPAIQEGLHVAREIAAQLRGAPSVAFRYRDKGSMATIGRNQAVAELANGWRFHGRLGWLMWLGLHLLYLIGFRNRATTLVNWVWNYLTYDRGARTILPPADVTRRE